MFVVLVALAVDEFFLVTELLLGNGHGLPKSRWTKRFMQPFAWRNRWNDAGFGVQFLIPSQVIFNRAINCPTRKWHDREMKTNRICSFECFYAFPSHRHVTPCKWNVWPVGMPATRCTLLLSVWQPVECTSLGSSMLDFTNGMCTHKPCTLQDATFASKFQVPHHHTERWQPCHTSYVAILSDTSCPSTSEFKPWNSDGTGNVQWGGCVCFNLATKQCEVPVLKTKLHLPLSSFGLQSMS